jgi:hypothetical protein
VWGRPLPGHEELPAGAAFAAEVFGFLGPDRSAVGADGMDGLDGADGMDGMDGLDGEDAVSLHRAGRWWRLSMTRGHVLARPPSSW